MRNTMLIILLSIFTHALFSQEVLDSSIVHHESVIYFKSDAHDLKEADKEAILKLLEEKQNFERYQFFVDAHTDDVGSDEYNRALSERRKQSIVDFLIQHQVSDSLIESNFHGESLRIAFAEDEKSRQLNRRAIVQLITKRKFVYVKGTVINEETQEPVIADVQLNTKTFTSKTKTDAGGRFRLLSPVDSLVSIEIVAKNYFIESKVLKITLDHQDKSLKIPLPKVEIGKKFTFKNMLFVGNKSIMLKGSIPVLDHLKRFMFVNDDQCIEIAGHINRPNASKVGLQTEYYKLSVARALEVHDALVGIGIKDNRLLARGYGNWEMLYPKAKSETQMKLNRRVEIIIAACDSTELIPNHDIPNRYDFNLDDPINRYYSEVHLERDIYNFSSKTKKDIKAQLKQMKKKKLDPTKYTFKELLIAFPNIPE